MAQIELITGQTGNGKSLLAITKGLAFLKEGRPVYAAGFKELDYEATGFLPLPTPFQSFDPANLDDMQPTPNIRPDWQLLEDAVIIYDECYSILPPRSSGSKVPVHVDAIARHRHYNIDLIFLTQKHDQLDTFIRGLVNVHTHVKRKFGFNGASLRHWDEFQLNTKSKPDSVTLWKYPKENFKFYKSATAHSIKKKIPWFVWAPIPLVLVIGGLIWYVVHGFGGKKAEVPPSALAEGGGAAAGLRGTTRDDPLRATDYAKWMAPTVAGQPWTAPAYSTLHVQTIPRVFCIAVEDANCKCITEQGTNYVVQNSICRTIARDGVYNPFLAPENERDRDRRPRDRDEDRRTAVQGGNASDLGGAVSSWPGSSMRSNYQPPQLTHAPEGASL